jgi:hypothetical protein
VSTIQTTTEGAVGSAPWQPPSRAVRWAAYATPLCVLPSALWRIWYVFVDANPACVGGGPAWERPYIASLSAVSVIAASLTVGLVRPWGEVCPRGCRCWAAGRCPSGPPPAWRQQAPR